MAFECSVLALSSSSEAGPVAQEPFVWLVSRIVPIALTVVALVLIVALLVLAGVWLARRRRQWGGAGTAPVGTAAPAPPRWAGGRPPSTSKSFALAMPDGQVRRYTHADLPVVIGRNPTGFASVIELTNDPAVSTVHAVIDWHPQWHALCIRDQRSTNGIAVNGGPTALHRLQTGDRIRIGSTELTFRTE